jgi:hypothetical protein
MERPVLAACGSRHWQVCGYGVYRSLAGVLTAHTCTPVRLWGEQRDLMLKLREILFDSGKQAHQGCRRE